MPTIGVSTVSEIMTHQLVSIDAGSNPSALDVANVMVKRRVGSVIVTESGRPIGIITQKDILRRVSAKDRKAGEVPVREIMSSPLVAVKSFDSVEAAAAAMVKHRIKRVAVVEPDGSLAGIVSVSDITKMLSKILTDEYDRYGSLKAMLQMSEA